VPGPEKLGLIRLVDHRVLELVVAELAATPQAQLSLNISPDTTMDPDWWASIESLMRAPSGVAERLIVEITETVAIQGPRRRARVVTRLRISAAGSPSTISAQILVLHPFATV